MTLPDALSRLNAALPANPELDGPVEAAAREVVASMLVPFTQDGGFWYVDDDGRLVYPLPPRAGDEARALYLDGAKHEVLSGCTTAEGARAHASLVAALRAAAVGQQWSGYFVRDDNDGGHRFITDDLPGPTEHAWVTVTVDPTRDTYGELVVAPDTGGAAQPEDTQQ